MRHVLSREGRSALERFAGRNIVVAFDLDGTLAPIIDDRRHVQVRPATRELLTAVAAK